MQSSATVLMKLFKHTHVLELLVCIYIYEYVTLIQWDTPGLREAIPHLAAV
jgi:hypothetical protein